jgi:hypothetical protein
MIRRLRSIHCVNELHLPRRVWLAWRSARLLVALGGDNYAFVPLPLRPAGQNAPGSKVCKKLSNDRRIRHHAKIYESD